MISPVGIFGGSFNPLHKGHVGLARIVQRKIGFKPLWIVPTGKPPHKREVAASNSARLKALRQGFRKISRTKVSDFELRKPSPSYALQTIRHFKKKHGRSELFFVMGSDAFAYVPKWFGFPKVLQACSYLVVTRRGYQNDLAGVLKRLTRKKLIKRLEAERPFCASFSTGRSKIHVLRARITGVSSSQIRDKKLKHGF